MGYSARQIAKRKSGICIVSKCDNPTVNGAIHCRDCAKKWSQDQIRRGRKHAELKLNLVRHYSVKTENDCSN